MPKHETCSGCLYWLPSIGSATTAATGKCRRNAPLPAGFPMREDCHWPTTHAHQWCGEFQDRNAYRIPEHAPAPTPDQP